jgi:hypothetical protein
MFKRLLLISLIALIPVQSWAVLDMSMQKQLVTPVTVSYETVASHPCHQVLDSVSSEHSIDSQLVQKDSGDRCYSCTLCMAFGLLPNSLGLLVADHYSQTLHTSLKTLAGIDRTVLSKPPIL